MVIITGGIIKDKCQIVVISAVKVFPLIKMSQPSTEAETADFIFDYKKEHLAELKKIYMYDCEYPIEGGFDDWANEYIKDEILPETFSKHSYA